jgi:hypothetical protein
MIPQIKLFGNSPLLKSNVVELYIILIYDLAIFNTIFYTSKSIYGYGHTAWLGRCIPWGRGWEQVLSGLATSS